mgnify:CR=1 FL=1
MIKYLTNGTIKYDLPTKNQTEADLIAFAASNYGFLLNTPAHRNKETPWFEFGKMIGKYSDHPVSKLIEKTLQKYDLKYSIEVWDGGVWHIVGTYESLAAAIAAATCSWFDYDNLRYVDSLGKIYGV